MRTLGVVLSAWMAAGPAAASDIESAAPDAVSLTLYRGGDTDGLVLVTETRSITLQRGRQRLRLRGVADGMMPQTAKITGLGGVVIEQNQDFDLLSPGSLLASSVGERVEVVRTDIKTGHQRVQAAIVRSAPRGVVLDIDGGAEALHCGGPAERLVFERLPEGLIDKPTLTIVADIAEDGPRDMSLTYLAGRLTWSADYVAQVAADGRSLDLMGLITLSNKGDTRFADALTDVVAGTLSRVGGQEAPEVEAVPVRLQCWGMDTTTKGRVRMPAPPPAAPAMPMSALEEVVVTAVGRREALQGSPAAIAEQRQLGDYKLYRLPEPTTVAAHQTKQVAFLYQTGVRFERFYSYRIDLTEGEEPQTGPAMSVMRLDNRGRAGLGKPLPAGFISVRETGADGGVRLVGEDRIRDIPIGGKADLIVAEAMDVQVRAAIVETAGGPQTDTGPYRQDMQIDVVNGKSSPVTIELTQPARGVGFKIVSATQKPGLRNGEPMWRLVVPAGGARQLRYRYRFDD